MRLQETPFQPEQTWEEVNRGSLPRRRQAVVHLGRCVPEIHPVVLRLHPPAVFTNHQFRHNAVHMDARNDNKIRPCRSQIEE